MQGNVKRIILENVDIVEREGYNYRMEQELKLRLADSIRGFRLPRYAELPRMGLYLEQTTEYINGLLRPLGCLEITGDRIRNYVKKGMIAKPVQKRYDADQIAYLVVIATLKTALSLENLRAMFTLQQGKYENAVAYDYFCMEMENILFFRFGLQDGVREIGVTSSLEKEMLSSAIIAVSHEIYLSACFAMLRGSAEA